MNRQPQIPITDENVDMYQRDGVVCLRDVLYRDWVDLLLPIVKRVAVNKDYRGMLPMASLRNPGRVFEEVRQFTFNSPLGEMAAKVLQSKEVRYFFEGFFAKAPQYEEVTLWHANRADWTVTGEMVSSIWIPLTPIMKANSLQILAGSHR